MSETVRVNLVRPGARIPARATEFASGFDIHACIDRPVVVGQHPVMIPTGIVLEVPWGLDAQFRPRSGLARQGVLATFGTLDADYRGEIMITLYTMAPDIESIYMMSSSRHSFISSSGIKEMARFGGDVSDMVPPQVAVRLPEALKAQAGQ